MYEIEDLVEASIRLLDKSPRSSKLDQKSLFWNLYEYQGCFDTKRTHSRVLPILNKHGFTDGRTKSKAMNTIDMVLVIIKEAALQDNVELVASWYKIGLVYHFQSETYDLNKIKTDPRIQEIRSIATTLGALSFDVYEKIGLSEAEVIGRVDDPFYGWWFHG